MDFIQISGTECDGIWGEIVEMGGKRGTGKGYVRLRKMSIQAGFLHIEIYNNKGVEDN